MAERFLRRPIFHLALILALAVGVYSNTMEAPFQWDEGAFIRDNPAVKDLSFFLDPAQSENYGGQYDALKRRYVGYLTFAINYSINGLDVEGYHVFNVAVHVLNGFLLYWIVLLAFETPKLRGSVLASNSRLYGLLAALMFVSHPVQTQAVTYVFQRLASLAALFYMLSAALYIKWRLGDSRGRAAWAVYAASLMAAVLAMKTKENAFTLPLAVVLCETTFFKGAARRRLALLVPYLLLLSLIPLSLGLHEGLLKGILEGYESSPRNLEGITSTGYFITQFRVLVTYLRLLVLPENLNMDYDYPLHTGIDAEVALSATLVLVIIAAGGYVYFRARRADPGMRLISFGVLWFFLAISIESSIIPLPMLINEYRIYLPSAGALMALAAAGGLLVSRLNSARARRAAVAFAAVVVTVFAVSAYARNSLWNSGIKLWGDTVYKSPEKARPHYNLALAYQRRGLLEDAMGQYEEALRLVPGHVRSNINIAVLLREKGETELARRHLLMALEKEPGNSRALFDLGLLYLEQGSKDLAALQFRAVLESNPSHPWARRFLEYLEEEALE